MRNRVMTLNRSGASTILAAFLCVSCGSSDVDANQDQGQVIESSSSATDAQVTEEVGSQPSEIRFTEVEPADIQGAFWVLMDDLPVEFGETHYPFPYDEGEGFELARVVAFTNDDELNPIWFSDAHALHQALLDRGFMLVSSQCEDRNGLMDSYSEYVASDGAVLSVHWVWFDDQDGGEAVSPGATLVLNVDEEGVIDPWPIPEATDPNGPCLPQSV